MSSEQLIDFQIKESLMIEESGLFTRREYKHREKIISVNIYDDGLQPINFINHSCQPNCLILGASIYALRDLEKDEEITIDYDKIVFMCLPWEFDCQCKNSDCRGFISGGFNGN